MRRLLIYVSDARGEQAAPLISAAFEREGLPAEVVSVAEGRPSADELRRGLSGAVGGAAGVLALTSFASPLLGELNLACVALGVPLIAAFPLEGGAQIGPAFLPGKTACVECFKKQLSYLQSHDQRGPGRGAEEWSVCASRPFVQRLAGEVRSLTASDPAGTLARGYVFRFGPDGGERRHRLLKSPLCVVCSDFATHPTESISAD